MTQPIKEAASMEGNRREEDVSNALDLEIFAFNGRRVGSGGSEEGCGKQTS